MPVYLRNFYYNKLAETKKKEQKEAEKVQRQNKSSLSKPNIPR
tara:strand:- start:146 stop:274 length:129 start_codon:yes stop_codon:yes gene_type:complete